MHHAEISNDLKGYFHKNAQAWKKENTNPKECGALLNMRYKSRELNEKKGKKEGRN